MNDTKTDENQRPDLTGSFSCRKRLAFIFLGLLAISIIAYFLLRNHWAIIITNHVGGLGIIGLFACLTAYIAKRKAYNYTKAFKLSFFLPIILGLITAIIFSLGKDFIYCGGGVSLLVSLIIPIVYLLINKKKNIGQ